MRTFLEALRRGSCQTSARLESAGTARDLSDPNATSRHPQKWKPRSATSHRKALLVMLLTMSTSAHAQITWLAAGVGNSLPSQGAALSVIQSAYDAPTATVLWQTIAPAPNQRAGTTSNTVEYYYGTPLTLTANSYTFPSVAAPGTTLTATSEAAIVAAAESDITQYEHAASSSFATCQIAGATPAASWVTGQGPADTGSRIYTLTWSGAPACAALNGGQYYIGRAQGAVCPTSSYGPMLLQPTLKQGFSAPDYTASDWVCTAQQLLFVVAYYPSLECPDNNGPVPVVGEPCDVASREYYTEETDYSGPTVDFTRYYHSAGPSIAPGMSGGWSHNFSALLALSPSSTPVSAVRPDGHREALTLVGSTYISSATGLHVVPSGSNWIAYRKDGGSEVYNASGQLTQLISATGMVTSLTYGGGNLLSTVADPFGHTLQFRYDSNSRLSTLIEPDGVTQVTYAYDSNSNLVSATYSDGTVRQYQYLNSTFPNNMTGIVDESGALFVSVQYDGTTGAVVSSQLSGGARAVSISYPNSTSAVVTDSLGGTTTYQFTSDSYSSPRVTSVQHNSLLQSYTVAPLSSDPRQRVTQTTDPNGNVTTYSYDTDHLTSLTEASGTSVARTTSFAYLASTSALPTLITKPLQHEAVAYYAGTTLAQTRTITDQASGNSRTWTYVYDAYGRTTSVKGPRTDLTSTTTYGYYTCTTGGGCGQLQTRTDAAGQHNDLQHL